MTARDIYMNPDANYTYYAEYDAYLDFAEFVIMQIMHFMQFLVRSIMQIMHMLQSITLANCITFKLHKYVESTRAADSSKLACGSEHCKLFLSLCEGCSCYLAEI